LVRVQEGGQIEIKKFIKNIKTRSGMADARLGVDVFLSDCKSFLFLVVAFGDQRGELLEKSPQLFEVELWL
jgi:hypothetical protein